MKTDAIFAGSRRESVYPIPKINSRYDGRMSIYGPEGRCHGGRRPPAAQRAARDSQKWRYPLVPVLEWLLNPELV
jgi:hypothetical protein